MFMGKNRKNEVKGLGGLYNGAGTDAPAASPYLLDLAVFDSADCLKVRVPSPLGLVMGMAYIVTECRPFPANVAISCHD